MSNNEPLDDVKDSVNGLTQIASPAARAMAEDLLKSLRTLVEEDIPRMLESCEEKLDELEEALEAPDDKA